MKNSILFSLTCLTLVLSGCFNRSTKVWDMYDPNDLDGDGIENACDVDYIDGPVIDSDKNGESDSCQPDTDGDGLIDAVDIMPLRALNGGLDLNTGCINPTPNWQSVYDSAGGEMSGVALAETFFDASFGGNADLALVDGFEQANRDLALARAGVFLEDAVLEYFDAPNDGCADYESRVMAAIVLRDVPPHIWLLWMSTILEELGAPRISPEDLDGDGIINELDPSVDLVVAEDRAMMLIGSIEENAWASDDEHEAIADLYFAMQERLIELLVESGINVNLIPAGGSI